MKNHRLAVQFGALALVYVSLSGGGADARGSGTVTGHGSVELKRTPEFVRVQVDILAKGKDVTEALGKLRERRQTAQKSLEQLGAAANGIEFGKASIVTENNDRRAMQMMMMRQMQMQGKKPAQKPKEPPPVTVSCTLKAEIRLGATDPEELLIAAHTLEERLKLADLGGTKALKQATPQDEEMEQEEAMAMMNYGNNEGPKRGEPIFVYVSKISEDEQLKARADAFKQAQREASKLAKAAGVELGPLAHLDDHSSPSYGTEETYNAFDGNYAYRVQQMLGYARSGYSGNQQWGEAIGLQPGRVSLQVVLSASFELKQPAGK